MTALLPVATHETAQSAMCDLIRHERDTPTETGLLHDWAMRVATENPEVLRAVNFLLTNETDRAKSTALAAMAMTYRVLSAQAEVATLDSMIAPAQPFPAILENFERQAEENFREVNKCGDCGQVDCACPTYLEGLNEYFDRQERKHGVYREGEFPGDAA